MGYYTSINEGLLDRFKKKPKPIGKPAPKENITEKYKFMDAATLKKFKSDVLKELTKICNKHRDIVGTEGPYLADDEYDNGTRFYFQIFCGDDSDDDAYDAYLNILDEFETGVKKSTTWNKYEDEGYDIDIGYFDDEEGQICLRANNRLYDEYMNQKRSHNVDPTLKGYFEGTEIAYADLDIEAFTEGENIFDKLYEKFATLPAIKDPPEDLHREAEGVFKKINEYYSVLPAGGLLNKSLRLCDKAPYIRSVDRSKKHLSKKGVSVYRLVLNISSLAMNITPSECMNNVARIILDHKFHINPRAKSKIKAMFNDPIWFYKYLSDGNILLCSASHSYVTQNGVFAGHNSVSLQFKVVKPNEKNLKKLNFIEAVEII